jgi:hypothetical protein
MLYFDVIDPILPIVNQSRLRAEVQQESASVAVLALSYAVAALGAIAATDGELSFAQVHCYNQTRELLDVCERQEDPNFLADINVLQAFVLLTLYEFKQPNFARSWMTLGRATRLCKMVGLDDIDGSHVLPKPMGSHISLPPPTSPGALEERRRTFWGLYVFDAFAAIKSEMATAFDSTQVSNPPAGPPPLDGAHD